MIANLLITAVLIIIVRISSLPFYPANTRHRATAGLILSHRLRRWANISPAVAQCLLFAGMQLYAALQSGKYDPWLLRWECTSCRGFKRMSTNVYVTLSRSWLMKNLHLQRWWDIHITPQTFWPATHEPQHPHPTRPTLPPLPFDINTPCFRMVVARIQWAIQIWKMSIC